MRVKGWFQTSHSCFNAQGFRVLKDMSWLYNGSTVNVSHIKCPAYLTWLWVLSALFFPLIQIWNATDYLPSVLPLPSKGLLWLILPCFDNLDSLFSTFIWLYFWLWVSQELFPVMYILVKVFACAGCVSVWMRTKEECIWIPFPAYRLFSVLLWESHLNFRASVSL